MFCCDCYWKCTVVTIRRSLNRKLSCIFYLAASMSFFFSPPNGLSSSRGQGPRLTLLSCLRKRLRHVLVSAPLKNKAFPNVAFFPIFHTARALEPTIGMDSGSPFRSSLRRCAISHHAPARVNVGALHGALRGIWLCYHNVTLSAPGVWQHGCHYLHFKNKDGEALRY